MTLRVVGAEIVLDGETTDVQLHITDDPNNTTGTPSIPYETAVAAIQAIADASHISVAIEGFGLDELQSR